jgi:hypothetical protein
VFISRIWHSQLFSFTSRAWPHRIRQGQFGIDHIERELELFVIVYFGEEQGIQLQHKKALLDVLERIILVFFLALGQQRL